MDRCISFVSREDPRCDGGWCNIGRLLELEGASVDSVSRLVLDGSRGLLLPRGRPASCP